MDPVPGQTAPFPWIRDTSIMRGADGVYYMTGTSGNMDAIHLWRSTDMQRWHYVSAMYTLAAGKDLWYNQKPGRFLWAPELHYFNGTYWIAWCASGQLGIGLLKSTTGKPEGPYVPPYEGNRPLIAPNIDASLFQDDDGTAYLVWQNGMIRKLNRQLSAFDGETFNLRTVDGVRSATREFISARSAPGMCSPPRNGTEAAIGWLYRRRRTARKSLRLIKDHGLVAKVRRGVRRIGLCSGVKRGVCFVDHESAGIHFAQTGFPRRPRPLAGADRLSARGQEPF